VKLLVDRFEQVLADPDNRCETHSVICWLCWNPFMDYSLLKEQAERCRRLAENADPFIKKRLLDLAGKYEVRLGRPSPAVLSLSVPAMLYGQPSPEK
jgi:hypothetical protein